MPFLEDLAWSRPAGLWSLAFPILLLLLARFRGRPERRPTGTVAVWRRVAAERAARGKRMRRRIPLGIWLAAAALTCAALALAGPTAEERTRSTWTVVVDASPSTGLPAVPDDPPGDRNGVTRLEVALEGATEWISGHLGSEDRVLWISSARGDRLVLAKGELPPPGWIGPPRGEHPEPEWRLHDRAGTIWVTDAVPGPEPASAGYWASGGPPVPGTIAAAGHERADWDGAAVRRIRRESAPGRAIVAEPDPGEIPDPIARLLEVWMRARNVAWSADLDGADLVVEIEAGSGERLPVSLGRDGWWAAGVATADGLATPNDLDGPGRSEWLAATDEDGRELPVVEISPGVVRLALRSLDEPAGDPAAFALSWGRLLDEALLPEPGVVSLRERLGAGEAGHRPPEPPPRPPAPDSGAKLPPALAALAAVLAAASLLLLWREPSA